jgi:restriction endonuclease S subunit
MSEKGKVPEGWVEKTLGDIFDLFAGGDLDEENYSPIKTNTHKYPIYSNSLNNQGLYGFTLIPKYKANSITITGRGSIGSAVYRAENFDAIIRLLVLTPKEACEINSQFVAYMINQYVVFSVESTGVPQLTVPQIRNIKIMLPPLPEQTAIAEVLSDMDSYIDSLEKLIAKKRAIKQGAMQELLTGKRRLPGFTGEWEVKQIGELFILLAGGDLDVINYSAIKTKKYKYPIFSNSLQDQGLYGYTSVPKYKSDSITITGRGSTGVALYRAEDFDAIIRLLVLTPNNIELTNSKFIRKSGLIPRSSAAAEITQCLQKSGIKPDGIINFLSTEPPFEPRHSLSDRRARLCGGSLLGNAPLRLE